MAKLGTRIGTLVKSSHAENHTCGLNMVQIYCVLLNIYYVSPHKMQ